MTVVLAADAVSLNDGFFGKLKDFVGDFIPVPAGSDQMRDLGLFHKLAPVLVPGAAGLVVVGV